MHIRDGQDLRTLYPDLSLDDLVQHYLSTQKGQTNASESGAHDASAEAHAHFRAAIERFLTPEDYTGENLAQWNSQDCNLRMDRAFEEALDTAQECFEVFMQRPPERPGDDHIDSPVNALSPLFSEIFQGFYCISDVQVCGLSVAHHTTVLASEIGAPRQFVVH